MSKILESLTEAQAAKMPEYVRKYVDISYNTVTDRAAAEASIKALLGDGVKFSWTTNPKSMLKEAVKYKKTKKYSELFDDIRWGSLDSQWAAMFSFFINECGVVGDDFEIMDNIVRNCGAFLQVDDVVFMSDKPTEIHMKDGALYNELGYAVKYGKGEWGVYALGNGAIDSLSIALLDQKLSTGAEVE